MATTTTYLGLTKPAETEAPDIAILNANMDKIDTAVGEAKRGKAAYSLIVNGWFVDPVNQRGKTEYTNGKEYTIDGWMTEYDTCLSVKDGYINVYGNWHAYQTIKKPYGTIYSLAARVRVNTIGDYTPNVSLGDYAVSMDAGIGEWKTYTLQVDLSSISGSEITVRLNCQGGSQQASISVAWVALYEGAYTADTLPACVPKGYAAELAKCKLYYRIMQTPCIPCANNPGGKQVYGYIQGTMRIAPTVICDNLFYFQGDGTYVQVTGATAALAGDGIRIAFDLAQSVNGNLAGVVGGTAITFDANM